MEEEDWTDYLDRAYTLIASGYAEGDVEELAQRMFLANQKEKEDASP